MIVIRVRSAALSAALVLTCAASLASAAELRKIQVQRLAQFRSEFPEAAVLSPDGAHVYVVSAPQGSTSDPCTVRGFARAADGSLSPIGSLSLGTGTASSLSITISPDGHHVYARVGSEQLAVLTRDPSTGTLTVEPTDYANEISANLVASPDGKNVYATWGYLLATYARDATTGALTRIDLKNGGAGPSPIYGAGGLAISPDGRNAYLGSVGPENPDASGPGPSLIVFARDLSTGTLDYVTAIFQGDNGVDGLSFPIGVAVSGDGRNVYVSGARSGHGDDVATFARDTSGALTYLGKVAGVGFATGGAIALSPDGERVIVTGLHQTNQYGADGISLFRRDPATGLLTYLETLLTDRTAPYLSYPTSIAFAPDGHDVYVTAGLDSSVIAYRVLPHCSIEPLEGCRVPTRPRRSQIRLAHGTRDSLQWRWRSGQATSSADFGDPRATTDYAFCVHREVAGAWQAPLQLEVAAASTCGKSAQPCWRQVGNPPSSASDVFLDPAVTQDGVAELRLNPGADGRASILLRGHGPALDLPTLPLSSPGPIVAQLKSSDGVCWSADYTAPATINDTRRFADSSD